MTCNIDEEKVENKLISCCDYIHKNLNPDIGEYVYYMKSSAQNLIKK